jgi:SanA protein
MQRLFRTLLTWLFRWVFRLLVLAAVVVLGINVWMVQRAESRIAYSLDRASSSDVALVLGTGKNTASGRENSHFRVRMDAAAALFKAARIQRILVSGDNSDAYYNEPRDMMAALRDRGVPPQSMSGDYQGLRTFDSIVRAHDVFKLKECVIVSDDFHLPRALWLADRNGLRASGFILERVPWEWSWKSRCREWGARVKAFADEFILGTQPAHPSGNPKTTTSVRLRGAGDYFFVTA